MSSRVHCVYIPNEGRGQRGSKGKCDGQVRSSTNLCVPRARDLEQVREITEK